MEGAGWWQEGGGREEGRGEEKRGRASRTRVMPYPLEASPRSHLSVQKRWPLPERTRGPEEGSSSRQWCLRCPRLASAAVCAAESERSGPRPTRSRAWRGGRGAARAGGRTPSAFSKVSHSAVWERRTKSSKSERPRPAPWAACAWAAEGAEARRRREAASPRCGRGPWRGDEWIEPPRRVASRPPTERAGGENDALVQEDIAECGSARLAR